jgi:cation transport regulator ChaB
MPYQKLDELPEAVKTLPTHGQEIWMAAFNSAFDQYKGDEEKAFATAWAAVKNKYKKEGDKWVPISSEHSEFPDWIEVFATGEWTDSAGNTKEWTLDDLKEIASLYDFKTQPAPIVIGHPETDSPAYGWIEALKIEGEKLLAKPVQLVEEFVDWVKRGLYKKISVAIYPDLMLKHVGFLGGVAPAVKGLKPVAFGNKKAGWTFEMEVKIAEMDVTQGFSPDTNRKGGKKMTVKEFMEKMRGFFSEAEKDFSGTDPGHGYEARFTEAEVQAREAKAKKDAETAAFAETEKIRKEKEDLDKKLKEIDVKTRKDGIAVFCEGLCKEGKLTPALRKIIEPIMVAVSDQAAPIEFSETVKKPALDGIKDFLTELPKVVTFKEVTTKEGPGAGGSAGEKLSALTKQKMEAKKDLSYGMAFAEVQKENSELAKEFLEEVRPKQK